MTDFTQDLFARRRNVADGNTRVVSEGKVWYDSITNSIRVSDGHTPGGQIITGQSGSYTLPTATPSVKGGVQLGSNIIATGASIDVLSPTKVSQLENDSNYLSGAVLATYATQTFVTTQGYITSAALSSGNANVIAANSTIQSISANLGAYQSYANTNISTLTSNAGVQATAINRIDANLGTATTNISNLVTQANANTTALIRGSVTTGPLTVDSPTGGYFANISGDAHPAYGRQSWKFFSQPNPSGGPGSWILFPDSTTQITAYPGTSTSLTTLDANIGTLSLGNISTQANLGAYQIYANANIGTLSLSNISTQANIGAFYNYANSKIGTNTNSNLVVVATTSSTSKTTGALVVQGGAGIAGDVNVGTSLTVDNGSYGNVTTTQFGSLFATANSPNNYSIIQAWSPHTSGGLGLNAYGNIVYSSGAITFHTGATVRDKDYPTGGITKVQIAANGAIINTTGIASTSTATGAVIVTGGVGISGNLNVGNYSNVYIASGSLTNRSALTISGNVYGRGGIGYLDAVQLTNNYSAATNPNKYIRVGSTGTFEIINSAYTTNLFNLTDDGALSLPGPISISGKKAVNGPAFGAYAEATLQIITSGSQQKVLFQTEEFDTDGCYASSRFTPNVEGYYQLNAEVRLDGSSGTGEIMIVLYKNTSEHKRGTNQSGSSIGTNFFAMQVSALVYANGTTDYFEIKVQQTSGGSMSVTAVNNPAITWFNGAMVRGA